MKTIKKGQIALIEITESRSVKAVVYDFEDDRVYLSPDGNDWEIISDLCENDEIKLTIYTLQGLLVMKSKVINPPDDDKFIVSYNPNNQIIERRQYIRACCRQKILIRAGEEYITAYTRDIGGGGVKFESEHEFKVGETLDVRLVIQRQKDIKIKGVVIKRINEAWNVYILRFTQIEPEDRQKIMVHCLKIRAKNYD